MLCERILLGLLSGKLLNEVRVMSELPRLNVPFPEWPCWLLWMPYIASPPGQVSQAHY